VEIDWNEVLDVNRNGAPRAFWDEWWLWACASIGQRSGIDVRREFENYRIVGVGSGVMADVLEDLGDRAPAVPLDAVRVVDAVGSTSDSNASFELSASVRIIAATRGERAVRRVPWRRVVDAMERNSQWLLALPSLSRLANVPRGEMAEFLRQARAIVRPWDVRTRLELALRELFDD
jgi:hypothetical protein